MVRNRLFDRSRHPIPSRSLNLTPLRHIASDNSSGMPVTFRCPICGKAVESSDPNMPFCSDRCRLLDLGNWASDKYTIPGNVRTELDDSDEIPTPEGPTR